MQLKKPSKTRPSQASRGPAGARAAGAVSVLACVGVLARGSDAGCGELGSGAMTAGWLLLLDGAGDGDVGALALLLGNKARAAEAARAATEAVAVVLVELAVDVLVIKVLAVAVVVLLLVLVSFPDKLAVTLTVEEGVLAVTVVVAVTAA